MRHAKRSRHVATTVIGMQQVLDNLLPLFFLGSYSPGVLDRVGMQIVTTPIANLRLRAPKASISAILPPSERN
jgi:hypothetical protein